MPKKNYSEAIRRNKRFLKRQMMDGILFKANVRENPYAISEERDRTWGTRSPLALTDKEWVLEECRRNALIYKDIDDDTIPEGYPTMHFGESLYSYLLGGEVHFVGNQYHTCSGAKPLIHSVQDLENLKNFENSLRVRDVSESMRWFAENTGGDFWLRYFICIDALNLAVELIGTTEAYLMLNDDRRLLEDIMEFGVTYNEWFYRLQKQIYRENNMAALGGDQEFYDLYDKTWYSIDAYDICSPGIYREIGMEYQQELIRRVGGGMLHTHGTGLVRLFPMISKLKGLSKLQIGRDLYSGETLNFDCIYEFREQSGDLPLQFAVSEEEFVEGLEKKTLPGGVEYLCSVKDVETANKLAYLAKEYKI